VNAESEAEKDRAMVRRRRPDTEKIRAQAETLSKHELVALVQLLCAAIENEATK
jgi:hypothetical protein